MLITLSPGEMAVAQNLAILRRCANQSGGTKDQRRDSAAQAISLDMLGTVSEIAWAKAWGRYPDLTINPRKGGADAITREGQTVDIKATDRPNGRLLATTRKRPEDADIYVLSIVRESEVHFVGWASADELLHPGTITDLGHGPTHALAQSQLHPIRPKQATSAPGHG